MSRQNKTGEFARGYALGFKHGKEYKTESCYNCDITNDDTPYNNVGKTTPTKKEDTRKDLFNDLFLDDIKMRLLSKNTCLVSDVSLNPLQKKFIKYYFNRTEAGELFIPVVKMRREGMTDILSEILFREYLAGKRVAYFVPNQKLVKSIKEAFEIKRKYHTHVTPIDGGSFDVYEVGNCCELNFRLTSKTYDIVVADELRLDVNFNYYVGALKSHVLCNHTTVVLAFTPSQRAKNFEDMKKFVENMECNGKIVYRYNTIAPDVAQIIRHSVAMNDDDKSLTSALIEMLGII